MRKDVWAVTSVLGVALGFLVAPSSAAPVIGSGAGGAKTVISESATLDLVRNGGGRGGHAGGRGGGHMSGHRGGHVRWHGGGSSYGYRRPYRTYSYGPRYYGSSCWYDASGVRICPQGYGTRSYSYGGYGHRYYRGHGHRAHGYVSGGHRIGGGGHRSGGGHRR